MQIPTIKIYNPGHLSLKLAEPVTPKPSDRCMSDECIPETPDRPSIAGRDQTEIESSPVKSELPPDFELPPDDENNYRLNFEISRSAFDLSTDDCIVKNLGTAALTRNCKAFWINEIRRYQSELERVELLTGCTPITSLLLDFLNGLGYATISDEDVVHIKFKLSLIEKHLNDYLSTNPNIRPGSQVKIQTALHILKVIGFNLKQELRSLQLNFLEGQSIIRTRLQDSVNISNLWQSENELSYGELKIIQSYLKLILHQCASLKNNQTEYLKISDTHKKALLIDGRIKELLLPYQPKFRFLEKLKSLKNQLDTTFSDNFADKLIQSISDISIQNCDYFDRRILAKVSLSLDDVSSALLMSNAKPEKSIFDAVQNEITQLQNECSIAWKISTDPNPIRSISSDLNEKSAQQLIDSLRAMRPAILATLSPRCANLISTALLRLVQYQSSQGPAQLERDIRSALKALKVELNSIGDTAINKKNYWFLIKSIDHLLEIAQTLNTTDAVVTQKNGQFLLQLLINLLPLVSGTEGSEHACKAIGGLIDHLHNKETLTIADSQIVSGELNRLYLLIDAIPATNDAQKKILDFSKKNIDYLRHIFVTSIAGPKSVEPSKFKSSSDFVEILSAISIPLRGLNPHINALISCALDRLKKLSCIEIEQSAALKRKIQKLLNPTDRKPVSNDGQSDAVLTATIKELEEDRIREQLTQKYILEEIARISLDLEKIVGLLNEYPDYQICNGINLGFIKKNLAHLAFLGGARFVEQARETMVRELTVYYHAIWSFAYNNMKNFGIVPGVSLTALITGMPDLMRIAWADLSLGGTWGTVIDDENFPGRIRKFTSAADLGVDLSFFESSGQISGSVGGYEEWDTPRKYVLGNFADLCKLHSGFLDNRKSDLPKEIKALYRPVVSDYFSRHAVLKDSTLQTDWSLLTGNDIFRIDRMEAIQKKYDDHHERISQSFSVLLSVLSKQNASAAHSEIALGTLDTDYGTGLDLTLTAFSAGGSASAGITNPVVSATAGISVGHERPSVYLTVGTPLVEKLSELENATAENLTPNSIHDNELPALTIGPADDIGMLKQQRLDALSGVQEGQVETLAQIRTEIATKSLNLRKILDAGDLSYAKMLTDTTRALVIGQNPLVQDIATTEVHGDHSADDGDVNFSTQFEDLSKILVADCSGLICTDTSIS